MKDPLLYFYSLYGFNNQMILKIETGAKYVGIMLKNGQVGVCSTLHMPVNAADGRFIQPDLNNTAHRICYNAYLNALLNYDADCEDYKDIFYHVDFSGRNQIIMVGFFRPLVAKFKEAGIGLTIFDYAEDHEQLTPIDLMDSALAGSGTVILTSTAIFNRSFERIISQTPDHCEVFLLGPSSLLHPDLKKYRNVKKIYGALFEPWDERILVAIAEGHGTQIFLKYGKKVNI